MHIYRDIYLYTGSKPDFKFLAHVHPVTQIKRHLSFFAYFQSEKYRGSASSLMLYHQ